VPHSWNSQPDRREAARTKRISSCLEAPAKCPIALNERLKFTRWVRSGFEPVIALTEEHYRDLFKYSICEVGIYHLPGERHAVKACLLFYTYVNEHAVQILHKPAPRIPWSAPRAQTVKRVPQNANIGPFLQRQAERNKI
jgi:hypothetical protein